MNKLWPHSYELHSSLRICRRLVFLPHVKKIISFPTTLSQKFSPYCFSFHIFVKHTFPMYFLLLVRSLLDTCVLLRRNIFLSISQSQCGWITRSEIVFPRKIFLFSASSRTSRNLLNLTIEPWGRMSCRCWFNSCFLWLQRNQIQWMELASRIKASLDLFRRASHQNESATQFSSWWIL